MQVTLDGAPAAFGWSGAATLGDVMARAEAVCAASGRVVVGLAVDGASLDMSAREAWGDRALEPALALAIATVPLRDLLVSTLDELREHFPVMTDRLQVAAASAQTGREGQAMTALAEVMDLWMACLSVVGDAGAALGADLAAVPVGTERLSDRLARLQAAVAPLDEALRRKDLVLVGDLCAYELPPLVPQWEETVLALRALAAAPAAS